MKLGAAEWHFWLYGVQVFLHLVLEECLPALTIPLPTDRTMKREHVYSKCIRCGWRQRSSTVSGNISFKEYYCKKCGGQLLICVDVRNAKDRNKSKNGDMGHKRQQPKTKNKGSQHWQHIYWGFGQWLNAHNSVGEICRRLAEATGNWAAAELLPSSILPPTDLVVSWTESAQVDL